MRRGGCLTVKINVGCSRNCEEGSDDDHLDDGDESQETDIFVPQKSTDTDHNKSPASVNNDGRLSHLV